MKMNYTCPRAAGAAVLCGLLAATPAFAAQTVTVLLEDTFADGSVAETSLPGQSALYIGNPGNMVVSPGTVQVNTSSGSEKMHTYFASEGSPVQLQVGQTLRVELNIVPSGIRVQNNGGKAFRFGVFFDPTDEQVTRNTNDDGGGSTKPWIDATGYGFQTRIVQTAPEEPETMWSYGKRVDDGITQLLGSNTAWALLSGGSNFAWVDAGEYLLRMDIKRVSETQNDVSFAIFHGETLMSEASFSDDGATFDEDNGTYNTFDLLHIRNSASAETATRIDFKRIYVALLEGEDDPDPDPDPEPENVWAGIEIPEHGWISTPWLGAIWIAEAPWAWSHDLGTWMWLEEPANVEDAGLWGYVFR